MKKIYGLLGIALAAATLAGCDKKSEDPTGTTGGSTKQPVPAHAEWTADEISTMNKILSYSSSDLQVIPHAYNLALEELGDEDVALHAKGDYADASTLAGYAAILEEAGYVESTITDDVYDVIDFKESVDPILFRKTLSAESSFPVFDIVLAAGVDPESDRLSLAATVNLHFSDDEFSNTKGGYGQALFTTTASSGKTYYELYCDYFAKATIYINGPESMTQEEADAAADKFLLPSMSQSTPTFLGVDDLAYMNPFSYGNPYSEEFGEEFHLYYAGFSAAEATTFGAELADEGYVKDEATSTKMEMEVYVLEDTAKNQWLIGYDQEDEFWQGEGDDHSGAYIFMTFIPAEEEAAA